MDDCKNARVVKDEADRKEFQDMLNRLEEWSNTWQMPFNLSKCHVAHFHQSNQQYQYTLCGEELKVVEVEKDLGVMVSHTLGVGAQVQRAAMKARQALGALNRAVTYRDKDNYVKLYQQYVAPHLEYCIAAWRPWREGDMAVLQSVQDSFLRQVSGLVGRDSESRAREVGIRTLASRYDRGDMIQTFKLLTGRDNVDYRQFFTLAQSRPGATGTRGSGAPLALQPHTDRVRTDMRRGQFSERIGRMWPNLDNFLKESKTLNQFKARYDNMY